MLAPGAGKLPAGSAAGSVVVDQLWAGVWLLQRSAINVCGVTNVHRSFFQQKNSKVKISSREVNQRFTGVGLQYRRYAHDVTIGGVTAFTPTEWQKD